MLRIIVNISASAAKSYYSQGLSKDDYYAQEKDTEIIGKWNGKGSDLLGLKGKVQQKDFAKLCDNINPLTGKKLTARNNENRRIGYDINFHAPKSVSIIYAITKDKNILEAFRASVKATMQEIEMDMKTRVRKAGQFDNRTTGNLIYGEFIHTTSRPVDGVPDPHLHAHCFTFNATFDHKEQQWKAGEFGKIKKDAAYFEAYFHSKFADSLKQLGYNIEQTPKGWEIAGVKRETIDKFSRRTIEIEELAKQKGIVDARAKDQLGAKTRKSKEQNLTANQLTQEWSSRLTGIERTDIVTAKYKVELDNVVEQPKQFIKHAIEHALERKSIAEEREILKLALKKSIGKQSPEQIANAYSKDGVLKAKTKDEVLLTTKEAINEERKLVRLATEGKGRYAPIAKDYQFQNKGLNKDQQRAVLHALTSKDQLIIVEGGAGTGKTTLMTELSRAINAKGRKIVPVAPSAEASRGVLQSEGFAGADTVAQFLQSQKMQESIRDNYLWIDEAGQIGNRTMVKVLEIADKCNARVILTGDTRQHNSVERGDAMRLILEKSKIKAVRTSEILRQKSASYKDAVSFIAENRQFEAFKKLEEIHAIHEIADSRQRYLTIAEDYLSTIKKGKSALVISPTHRESEIVTKHIREKLKENKRIGQQEQVLTVQKNLSPTEAEKKELAFYQTGMSIQFHQNVKGFKRGGIYDVIDKNAKSLIVSDGTNRIALPLAETAKFSVYEKRQISLSKGDTIRITQNGFSLNGKRLNNGNTLAVKGFDKEGNIICNTGNQDVLISGQYRNLTYGYCSTSHSSQGKTVDKVIISQSTASIGAASREQFYVSVSRGKAGISIYTDNKEELKKSVVVSAQRTNATDVFKNTSPKRQQILVSRLTELSRAWYQRTAISVNRTISRR
jgi:conjugative relaxase-like TrwC/TraI family protein